MVDEPCRTYNEFSIDDIAVAILCIVLEFVQGKEVARLALATFFFALISFLQCNDLPAIRIDELTLAKVFCCP